MQQEQATYTKPSDLASSELLKFCALPAPDIIEFFPSAMGGRSGAAQTMVEFLYRLRFEAIDILDRGDSIVPQSEIMFTMEDTHALYCAAHALGRLQSAGIFTEDLLMRVRALPEIFKKIEHYYSEKIRRSGSQRDQVLNAMHKEDLRKQLLMAKGQEGIFELYEVDRIHHREGLRRANGTLDFLAYRDAFKGLAEARELHTTKIPQLLGKSPGMTRLLQEEELLHGDKTRNRKVLSGINLCACRLNDALYDGKIMPLPSHYSVAITTPAPGNQ